MLGGEGGETQERAKVGARLDLVTKGNQHHYKEGLEFLRKGKRDGERETGTDGSRR